jgi:hypothetical protein
MFMSQMAFYNRISDPAIGGIYMTTLATISNVMLIFLCLRILCLAYQMSHVVLCLQILCLAYQMSHVVLCLRILCLVMAMIISDVACGC